MRRYLAVAVAVLAFLGALAPPAFAQAPAPKVTIEGLVDQTMTYSKNMSIYDLDVTRDHDKSWTGRTRGNLYFTAEVGKVKAFTEIRHEFLYGGAGSRGQAVNPGGAGPFGVNNGTLQAEISAIDMVQLYTEFPLAGEGSLLPFVPIPGLARVGFQNFDVDTYKLGALAWGFYPGAHIELDLVPGAKFTATYAQIEDSVTGRRDGFTRGDDFATIFGLEMSPMKGLNVKPVYAYYFADGTSAVTGDGGNAGPRVGVGGVSDTGPFFPTGTHENRHTFGIDATWTSGPWSLAPTIYYQTGTREMVPTVASGKKLRCGGGAVGAAGGTGCVEQDMDAWLFDVQGGWQSGPLQLEGLFVYSPGNNANEDMRAGRTIHYYQPISTDAIYGVNWGAIVAITYDYKQQLGYAATVGEGSTSMCRSCYVSYDKYGRLQIGGRASYNVTPAFKLRGVVTSLWTAEDVDTLATVGAGGVATDLGTRMGPRSKGTDSYLGTETDIGFEWKFAPNITFAWIYAHLFSGNGLGNACANTAAPSGGPVTPCPTLNGTGAGGAVGATARDAKDIDALTTMIRYVF